MNPEESYYPADVQQPPQEPPHSIAAEGAVIGGLMIAGSDFKPAWASVSKTLVASDFYFKNHQVIFKAIKSLVAAGQNIDVVTVADELDKKPATKNIGGIGSNLAYIGMLARDTPTAANVDSYVKIVKDHAVLRALAFAGQAISQAAQSKSTDLDAIVAKTKSLLAEHDKQAKATFNAVLDNAENTAEVDLLCFLDDDHLLKKLSINMAEALFLPPSTVFLMGIGTFSSMACRKYAVQYPDGTKLPIGLYAIAEQPPGTGKSRCLNTFQKPFYKIHKAVEYERICAIQKLEQSLKINGELTEDEKKRLFQLTSHITPSVIITNATSAGLETVLIQNRGYFSAASAEQGMFNTLFSQKANGGVVNNDAVLNGFNGDFINVVRTGRDTYSGNVVGSIVCFAQNGSIEGVLDASNGTGLAERYLMLVEPDKLGKRNWKNRVKVSDKFIFDYEMACNIFSAEIFEKAIEYDDLSVLLISENGFSLIDDYRIDIEPYIGSGGKYSSPILQTWVAKVDMHIMKIAANLHLLDAEYRRTLNYVIADRHIESAINIVDQLLQHLRKMLIDKGIIGLKAEEQIILGLFTKSDNPKSITLSYTAIFQKIRKVKPFADMQNCADTLRACLDGMTKQDLLIRFEEKPENGKKLIEYYRLGQ